ncbi:MAG TPA: hypothetical protein VI755_08255 [Anaerolineales bacterium]|nr:hypothetical protein [Anaerolineales bacterium]
MEFFFVSNPPHRTRPITWAWLVALYLVGAVLWGYFFSWGRFSLNFHDWAHITGPRLAFLKSALVQGLPPLHISDSYPLGVNTDRFLAIPDQILSPQTILLRILSIETFVVGNVLLLYSLGYGGLLWLRRKFSLSPVAFIILFLLFNFNGHILAHFAVGHATWGGYFLFPWFAILVFQLVEGERGWTWIAKMALLLFAIFLQGSFHQFVWALIFLALLAVAKRGYFLTAGGGALFAVLLSLVRILPAASLVGKFSYEFWSGYPTLVDLWQSLVTIYPPGTKTPLLLMPARLGYWEVNLYVGLAGAVFLLYFGVWRWLRAHADHSGYLNLALPVLGLVVMSIGQIFSIIRLAQVPLLEGESVTTRIISLPFVFIIIFAVIHFQGWLDQPHRSAALVYLILSTVIIISLNDLGQNYRIWQVAAAAPTFKEIIFDPRAWMVTNHPDPAYLGLLLAGAALSLVSLGVLLFFTWRSRRQTV